MLALGRLWRESLISLLCFTSVLAALAVADGRVRDRVTAIISNAPQHWPAQVEQVVSVLAAAARQNSMEHAPMVVFAGVAALLVLAMLRS